MRLLFAFFFVLCSPLAQAHDHDSHLSDLKSSPTPSGTSILQLGSTWKNQKGEKVKLTDLQGQSRLVVLIFTRCETACPLIIEDLKVIAKDIDSKERKPVEVSIFSLDSFRETPDSLLAFSAKRKLPSRWGLFTSDADSVAELAASLGVQYKRLQNGDFIHSNVIFFLNTKGEVIAKKEGLNTPRKEFIKKINSNA